MIQCKCACDLLDIAQVGTLTLVYAAHDPQANNAVVLAQWLEEELDRRDDGRSPVCYGPDFSLR